MNIPETTTNVASGSTPPKLESDTVMSQEFEDALEDAEVPERDQDSAQIESLLGPEFQAAFEAAKDSLRNLESVTKNFKDDKEGHIQGLMTELDQRQEILEDLSLTIRNHETTILKQKSDIDDLGTVMATEVEARDRTIAELQAKVQQPSLVNGANQPATASPSVTNAASSDSRIKELEKKLKKSEAENQKQAQNIADFVADPENFKIVHLTKLEAKNQEKDDRIQSLEAELLKAQSEVEQLQRVSSNPASIKSVDTHGLRFQDAFVKVPDEVSKASLYKERVTPKFSDENNRWWQQTRMLQDGIVIAGTSSDRVETINGATYDCYEEKGKQKRLKHVDENSLVKHDGKFYVSWEILKETEPEEPDFDY